MTLVRLTWPTLCPRPLPAVRGDPEARSEAPAVVPEPDQPAAVAAAGLMPRGASAAEVTGVVPRLGAGTAPADVATSYVAARLAPDPEAGAEVAVAGMTAGTIAGARTTGGISAVTGRRGGARLCHRRAGEGPSGVDLPVALRARGVPPLRLCR